MTQDEVLNFISKHPKMEPFIAEIWQHKDFCWEKPSGLNAIGCIFFNNSPGKENELIVQSGAGDRSENSNLCVTHEKIYYLKDLTPDVLNKIIDKDLPELYGQTYKDILDYLSKNKKEDLAKDFTND